MKCSLLLIFLVLGLLGTSFAEPTWKDMGFAINCSEFNCVAVGTVNPLVAFAGTSNGAYMTRDGGRRWEKVFIGRGEAKNVRYIYIINKTIYLCTDQGLYASMHKSFRWKRFSGIASKARVFSMAALSRNPPILFIATDDGLYRSVTNGRMWERVKGSCQDAEDTDERAYSCDMEEPNLPKIRTIAASFKNDSVLYLGTENGIYISKNGGKSFRRFSDEGLLSKEIGFITESQTGPYKLYAIAGEKIYYFEDLWRSLEYANTIRGIRCIAFDLGPLNSAWAATKRTLYRSVDPQTDTERAGIEASNTLNSFKNEPPIAEVQKKAVKYAEVCPEKIAGWRRRANMSAVLPRVSFGIDKSKDDTYEIYTSASKQYFVQGPQKSSDGWDITFSWDLGDLIWNGDQTLIDVRSKLMVQLRDDILDEVTSYYFERRRLQIELLESELTKRERLAKELRIEELTANIDGLTGGYFNRRLNSQ